MQDVRPFATIGEVYYMTEDEIMALRMKLFHLRQEYLRQQRRLRGLHRHSKAWARTSSVVHSLETHYERLLHHLAHARLTPEALSRQAV